MDWGLCGGEEEGGTVDMCKVGIERVEGKMRGEGVLGA